MATSQKDKNQAENQNLEIKVASILGPPPRSELPIEQTSKTEPDAELKSSTAPVDSFDTDHSNENIPQVVPPIAKAESSDNTSNPINVGETVEPVLSELNEGGQEVTMPEPVNTVTPFKKNGLKQLYKKLWRNPRYRKLIIVFVLVSLVATLALPSSRYFILNNLGVRGSATLTVLDNSTQLPLKNVDVSLANQTVKTDGNGIAKLSHIKLGNNPLVINKRAFAVINKRVVIGWGSNPLGSYSIDPTGIQFAIFVKDWLTSKPITKASANGGGADAVSDNSGKILLTIDSTVAQLNNLEVTVKSENYRDEIFNLVLNSKTIQNIHMVTNRRNVYISNKQGKYDVYAVDIDGKNPKLVLAGTGLEREGMVLVQHPSDDQAALVSTRVNARNNDGYLLSTLTLINLKDNNTRAIAQAEQVQIVGWAGTRLIYVQIAAGASASSPQRFRLMSYDYKTSDKKQIDSANLFNDVLLADNYIYYAPSAAYKKDASTGLIRSTTDGSDKNILLKEEVWNIFRVNFETLNLATAKNWYEYNIGSTAAPVKLKDTPSNPKNRLFIPSLDGKQSLWIDQRDGKGLLINYDKQKQTDTTLVTANGIAYPAKWLTSSVIVYRIHNQEETADYVLDITGGKTHKITDLYNASGIDRWYYYN